MATGGKATGCGHEVVTALSRITEEETGGEEGKAFRDAPFQ
jgi:hypothetical protein